MQTPALMTLASGAARHAAARQAHAARNLANADTPGFRPSDLSRFDPFRTQGTPRATRASHLSGGQQDRWDVIVDDGPLDPNGNGVDLQNEILRATDAQRAHSRAIRVYQASLDILRASIARGR